MRNTRVLLSREHWVEAAIDELSVSGLDGVAVESLARRLKISKGSFYWHFRDRKELVAMVLETWKNRAFLDVVAALGSIEDPRRRLVALVQTAWADHHHLKAEGALVSAAVAGNQQVIPVVREVIAGRLDYLRGLYREMGLSPNEAGSWAITAYSAYAGLVQLVALRADCLAGEAEVRALAIHIESVLMPASIAGKSRAARLEGETAIR